MNRGAPSKERHGAWQQREPPHYRRWPLGEGRHSNSPAAQSRFARLPDTPTLAEAGVKFDFNLWQGVAAPAGTPEAIVNKLSAALNKALSSPEVKKRLHDLGAEAQTSSPPEFTAFVAQEGERLGRLIADKHIAID